MAPDYQHWAYLNPAAPIGGDARTATTASWQGLTMNLNFGLGSRLPFAGRLTILYGRAIVMSCLHPTALFPIHIKLPRIAAGSCFISILGPAGGMGGN